MSRAIEERPATARRRLLLARRLEGMSMTHRNPPLLEMADMRAAGATWVAIGRHVGVSGPTARRWIAGPLPSRTLALMRPPRDAEATWARLMGATAARFNDAVTRDEARMLRAIGGWE